MNKQRFQLLLLLVIFSSSSRGQFLDMAIPVELDFKKSYDRYSGTSYSQELIADLDPNREDAEGIIFRIQGMDPISVRFRFLNINGLWSNRVEAKIFPEPFSDRLFATYRGFEFTQSKKIEITITSDFDSQILTTGIILSEQEEIIDSLRIFQKVSLPHIPKPHIISREEWNAKPPNFGYTSMPYYDKITLHHAAGFSATTIEEGIIQMQAIQELHQDVRGWSDIGYHFIVDKGGNIYQARPETVLGAHTSGANTGNIGVCVLGCYHPPVTSYYCYDEMTVATRDTLVKLYAWISEEYGYDNPHILKGHRDYYDYEYTSCPGDNIWALLPNLRDDITLYLEYGDIPSSYRLFQNYPNPFNNLTTIPFDVSKEGEIIIRVVDILGRPVKTLANDVYAPGYNYNIQWDGKNESGEKMGSGLYIYQIEGGNFDQSLKMVLLK